MITKKRLTRGTAALIMIAIPGLSSSAETIDLSIGSPLGKTGSATATYAHGLEAHGQYLSDTGWADADLLIGHNGPDMLFGNDGDEDEDSTRGGISPLFFSSIL